LRSFESGVVEDLIRLDLGVKIIYSITQT